MRNSTPVTVAVLLLATISAGADEIVRKGGEWRSTVTGVGPEPQTMVQCLSQATWEEAMTKMGAGKVCAKKNITKSGDQLTIDIACGKMTMQGTATLSGDSAYTADLTMHMGDGSGAKVYHTVTKSEWIGACKPGERVVR
jgi:Protein of unknown function (DUF3617)